MTNDTDTTTPTFKGLRGISDDLWLALRVEATRTRRSMGACLTEAIEAWLAVQARNHGRK